MILIYNIFYIKLTSIIYLPLIKKEEEKNNNNDGKCVTQ